MLASTSQADSALFDLFQLTLAVDVGWFAWEQDVLAKRRDKEEFLTIDLTAQSKVIFVYVSSSGAKKFMAMQAFSDICYETLQRNRPAYENAFLCGTLISAMNISKDCGDPVGNRAIDTLAMCVDEKVSGRDTTPPTEHTLDFADARFSMEVWAFVATITAAIGKCLLFSSRKSCLAGLANLFSM
jgi:hypothetical protein